jgi:hypothetical protein
VSDVSLVTEAMGRSSVLGGMLVVKSCAVVEVSNPEPVMTIPARTVPTPASPVTFVMVIGEPVPVRG